MKLLTLITAALFFSLSSFTQELEIVDFSTEKVNNGVAITWSPSVQPETNYFEIQKSNDAINWKVIAIMFPFEDATVSHIYRYNDKSIIGATAYYRIRQIDINKNENFSRVVKLNNAVTDK
ncbi:MAG TPA: hypothetical protein VM101_05250 [Flavitalea sp.]|nr:hypothetical protein [Flavitalea sp.]